MQIGTTLKMRRHRRGHGTKATGRVPHKRHHHENKRIRAEEDALKRVREDKQTLVVNKPMPLIDIGVERLQDIIREITGPNEDAYQDVMVALINTECQTEEEVRILAIETKRKTMRVHNYADLSLDKPFNTQHDGTPRSLLDIIPSPELIPDPPPNKKNTHKYSTKPHSYLYKQGMDEDVAKLLREKYPGIPLRHALRTALGLTTGPTDIWKPEEIAILQDTYHRRSNEAIANKLGRTTAALSNKAYELGLKKEGRPRFTPEGCFVAGEVMKIFSFSSKHLTHIGILGYLPGTRYKTATIYKDNDIVAFIRSHPFEYRHDIIDLRWKRYVPREVFYWLTLEQATSGIFYEASKIRRMIRRDEIPIKYYCPHTHAVTYVMTEHINNALFLEEHPLPYRVACMGDKTHYVYLDEDEDLMRVCSPGMKGIPKTIMKEYNYDPFVVGVPTCLKCLMMAKNEKARAGTLR